MKFPMVYSGKRAVGVALFTRAWIEIVSVFGVFVGVAVALFTRAWIEMDIVANYIYRAQRRPFHEGVD